MIEQLFSCSASTFPSKYLNLRSRPSLICLQHDPHFYLNINKPANVVRVTLTLTLWVCCSVTHQSLFPSCSSMDQSSRGITLQSLWLMMIEQLGERNTSHLSVALHKKKGESVRVTLEGLFSCKDIYHRQANVFYAQETPRRHQHKCLQEMKYSCRVKYGSWCSRCTLNSVNIDQRWRSSSLPLWGASLLADLGKVWGWIQSCRMVGDTC